MNALHLAIIERHPVTEAELEAKARDYMRNATTERTRKAHDREWAQFAAWAASRGREALPASPGTVALYVTELADSYKIGTIRVKLASISKAHKANGLPSPTANDGVKACLAGLARTKAARGEHVGPEKKAAILSSHVKVIVHAMGECETLRAKRDRALLLLGFAGAFRRSELAALDVDDLEFRDDHLLVRIRRSKTNQDGTANERKRIGYATRRECCPIHAVREWLDAAGIADGPLFRAVNKSDRAGTSRINAILVNRTCKRLAADAGLDPARVGAHSLRSGFVTTAMDADIPEVRIMDVTGHRSVAVMRSYRQASNRFDYNATAAAGL